jgi:hypothetical protein
VKMRNEACALVLLCHAMFQTVRSESDMLATSYLSNFRRDAALVLPRLPSSPPPLHAPLLDLSILDNLHLQGIHAVQAPKEAHVLKALQLVGACVPPSSSYAAAFYDMATAYSHSVRLTFASLVRSFREGKNIVPPQDAKTFSEALAAASTEVNLDLHKFVNSVVAEGGASPAAPSVAPVPAPLAGVAAVKRPFSATLGVGAFGSGDRQGGFVRQECVPNALVHGSGLLPNLNQLRGVGRPTASELEGRAQWATVEDTGQRSVAITAVNQVAIYRAYKARPSCVTVILGHLSELVQRQPGVPFKDARAEDALTAPVKRSGAQLAMVAAAFRI